ncbi:MAG: carbohydrate ABC transporter permease, partial [Anaerolineae bacterium]|nr:carbohydrate ABC transporter permease [Anaerolineae bacterium]
YILLMFLGFLILAPLLWMVSTSLKDPADLWLVPPKWVPIPPRWANYREALTSPALPFGRFAVNTSVITVVSVIGQLLSSPLVAYSFARLRFRGKAVLFMLVLGTMMLPAQVTMIPVFILFKNLGWLDTFIPLMLPHFFGSAYFIFLLRQFMLTIPPELGDAAKIDGCGYFGTFSRIFLPLSKPALATVAIFTFTFAWNDFMGPVIYLNSVEKWTLAVGLRGFVAAYGQTRFHLLMAASLVTVLPCVALYFFAQRLFIQGIVITGIKG